MEKQETRQQQKMICMHARAMAKGIRIVEENWDTQCRIDQGPGGPVSYPHATFVLRDLLQNGLQRHVMCNSNCHSLSGGVVHGCRGGKRGGRGRVGRVE